MLKYNLTHLFTKRPKTVSIIFIIKINSEQQLMNIFVVTLIHKLEWLETNYAISHIIYA